ncbi:MAG: methionyl-tRNA formyltransferase [Acidimicrobiia bacterium]|nr:methionyl-tRNA formyltransferase [Acidimicrobiia bacterium]
MAVPPTHPRRLAFLGTPQWAVPTLEALVAGGFEVAVVVTGPDRRRGRGGATSPSPVKAAAERLGLRVAHDVEAVVDAEVDLGVVVAFGHILGREVLEAVPMVNLHFSLLPRWRGAAPVQRAVMAGDERTGVCVMAVEEGLDTGGVYAVVDVPIGPTTTVDELGTTLADLGAELMVATLTSGLAEPEPQLGEPTYARKLTPDDLRLDWSLPAEHLGRVVRVGGAWTTLDGRRLKIHRAEPVPAPPPGIDTSGTPDTDTADTDDGEAEPGAECGTGPGDGIDVWTGDGVLRLVEVQPEGKARQGADAWRRGLRYDRVVLGT